MQAAPILVASLALSVCAAVGVVLVAKPEQKPTVSVDTAPLQRQLEALTTENRQLQDRLKGLEGQLSSQVTRRAPDAPGLDEAAVRALVADLLEERAPVVEDPARAISSAQQQFQELIALDNLHTSEAEAIWAAAAEAGTLDAIVEAFRDQARANPNDADSQSALGTALIQQLQRVGDPMTQSALAMQADKAFDEALDIDESHWEARFTKAVSYSFWPAVMGKQPEAIRHFETLLRQQEQGAPEAHFAQTYLFLGNLYQQQGNTDKAAEIWNKGVHLFPASQELLERVSR